MLNCHSSDIDTIIEVEIENEIGEEIKKWCRIQENKQKNEKVEQKYHMRE